MVKEDGALMLGRSLLFWVTNTSPSRSLVSNTA